VHCPRVHVIGPAKLEPLKAKGGTIASTKAGTQVDRPACKLMVVELELHPSSTSCGVEDIVLGLGQQDSTRVISLNHPGIN
jgi:hypothetical protein